MFHEVKPLLGNRYALLISQIFLLYLKFYFLGVLSKSVNETENTIDIIFLTYWSAGYNDVQIVENILQKCIQRKIAQGK